MRNLQSRIVNAAVNATTNFDKVGTSQIYAASFAVLLSDNTSTGTAKIQFSNDPCPYGNLEADFTPSYWVDVPSATVTVTAGQVAVTIPMPLNISYRWIRPVWTRTAGAGTISVDMNAQGY